MSEKLMEKWRLIARDLGLNTIVPFQLPTGDQEKLDIPVLLKDFGARNGMLIVTDYSTIEPHLTFIANQGYGFSTLSEPNESGSYDQDSIFELLRDWGWSGAPEKRPVWI